MFGLTGERSVTVAAGAPRSGGTRVVELHDEDGELLLAVDRDDGGWSIVAPAHGHHHVSPDGRTITRTSDEPDGERLLIAQTLPTAAALQGLDPLHASAVLTTAGVVALSGPSGSGKSTLAAELARRGARPFADDVLATEPHGADAVLAHPGPAVDEDPAPLHALVLLDRVAPGAAPEADLLREILAAGFVSHVDPPARLLARLEVAGRLLRAGRVHRLVVPPRQRPAETADAIEALIG